MHQRLFPQSATRRGFTLIEVILATLIFGITLAAIATVMRTGVRAWTTGHGASEIFQTARIAQEVINRDLDNMVYLNEDQYNATFNASLTQNALGGDPEKMSRMQKDQADKGLQNIAPPIDLSFRSTDSDKADQLTFARGYKTRYAGEESTWGMRRVTYFVRDKTLYRVERDPFGLSPSRMADIRSSGGRNDKRYNNNPQAMQDERRRELESRFIRNNPNPKDGESAASAGDDGMMPTKVETEEPLCEGVEIFNITFGYFKDGEWAEANDWDSHANKYRFPPDDGASNGRPGSLSGMPLGNWDPSTLNNFQNQLMQANHQPDNLPGYMAIQLGIRTPGGKGRLYSFTIYHSVPLGMETDDQRESGTPH